MPSPFLKKKLAPSEYPSDFATIREIVDFLVPAVPSIQKIHLPIDYSPILL
jgi:hypothetical protein